MTRAILVWERTRGFQNIVDFRLGVEGAAEGVRPVQVAVAVQVSGVRKIEKVADPGRSAGAPEIVVPDVDAGVHEADQDFRPAVRGTGGAAAASMCTSAAGARTSSRAGWTSARILWLRWIASTPSSSATSPSAFKSRSPV